jgi:hypothetical protein
MEIRPFLELCSGTWFSQRTRYALADRTAENHKSELAVAFLEPGDDCLRQLCDRHRHVEECLGGWQVNWSSSGDWGSPKVTGTATIAFLAETGKSAGKLLRSPVGVGESALQGSFRLDGEAALTLRLDGGNVGAEERIWFASDNLRLRTTVIQQGDRFCQTAFYSEIRKIQVPSQNS